MNRFASIACAAVAAAAGAVSAQPVTPAAPAAPVQDPAALRTCLQRFARVGLPRFRGDDALDDQIGPICRRGYALSFNRGTNNPDWVLERLTPATLRGAARRRDNFSPDPLLGLFSPTRADFNRSGFDRGHQAPAADAKFDQTVMDESFYMSNMSPQVGIGFNRGQWKLLEEAVRAWVLCGGREDVVVMTGPIYGDADRRIGPATRPIRVPAAYYKIVYDMDSGRAVGFRLDNRKHRRTELAAFVVPIAEIEEATGLDFFPALSRRRQNQLEADKGAPWGHDEACDNLGGD